MPTAVGSVCIVAILQFSVLHTILTAAGRLRMSGPWRACSTCSRSGALSVWPLSAKRTSRIVKATTKSYQ